MQRAGVEMLQRGRDGKDRCPGRTLLQAAHGLPSPVPRSNLAQHLRPSHPCNPSQLFPPLPISTQSSLLVMTSLAIFLLKQYSKTSQNTSQRMKTILLLVAGLGRSGNVPFTLIAERSRFVCSIVCTSVKNQSSGRSR
ncbi:hypothetical protein CY34DRAFT_187826 [Suillus luteus UH-Slu-Lm8-n1]|uniref:Uncharacterized protein n=1 Tax=Suillus luteus UH-Slu-Lm8-n1 TaxID=930992 RepID=A0A0D0A1R6_9AGAM|nr:hypothetical protein CY34DRAFT_187826 [Suillus luteus UH-Slu-Lm8-n1]